MKYRDQLNKPEVTEEIKKKITEDFSALLNHIDQELSEFYSLFTSVYWDPSKGNYNTEEDGDCYVNIILTKVFGGIKTGFTLQIKLAIQQFLYKTTVFYSNWSGLGSALYNKELSYTEFLNEQDKEDIVNAIGDFLNQFIETKGGYVPNKQ